MSSISFSFERALYKKGFKHIAGVDEAGRGPLAGPVVAAACILPEETLFVGLDDSKKLKNDQRERLFEELTAHPGVIFGVGIVDVDQIDKLNILQATLLAMLQAAQNLKQTPDYLLIDGIHPPKTKIPLKTIVQGDGLSYSIAAASILAKVSRDRMMVSLHERYPEYGFNRHKGYATHDHLTALQAHGPCSIHRKTFEPIKSLLLTFTPDLSEN